MFTLCNIFQSKTSHCRTSLKSSEMPTLFIGLNEYVKHAVGYQGFSAVCPLCGCAIDDDGGLRMELWEASDFIFQRRQQRLNEEWRRNVANSFQPSPNFTSCEKWTGPLPRNVALAPTLTYLSSAVVEWPSAK